MTDYERKRRDECIKLRASEQRLKEMVRGLIHQRDCALRERDAAVIRENTWALAHVQLCEGMGKKS